MPHNNHSLSFFSMRKIAEFRKTHLPWLLEKRTVQDNSSVLWEEDEFLQISIPFACTTIIEQIFRLKFPTWFVLDWMEMKIELSRFFSISDHPIWSKTEQLNEFVFICIVFCFPSKKSNGSKVKSFTIYASYLEKYYDTLWCFIGKLKISKMQIFWIICIYKFWLNILNLLYLYLFIAFAVSYQMN